MTAKEFSRSFGFSFKLLFSPIKNFYDLKFEKKGRLETGLFIVVLVILTFILQRQLTGMSFQRPMINPKDLNIISEILSVLVPFFLWCTANWALTTLMDGDGSYKDIVMASGYALFPIVLINIPLILLSHVMTREEGGFYYIFMSIATYWSFFQLFISNMVIHQYSVKKALVVVLMTIIGMGIISFIALLFTSFIGQLYAFGYSVYKELIFRL